MNKRPNKTIQEVIHTALQAASIPGQSGGIIFRVIGHESELGRAGTVCELLAWTSHTVSGKFKFRFIGIGEELCASCGSESSTL